MKARPPPLPRSLSAVAVEISSLRKPYRGVKSAGGGDCEWHGAKVFRFCPNYSTFKNTPSVLVTTSEHIKVTLRPD